MDRIIYRTPNELDFYNLYYSTSLSGDLITDSIWSSTDSAMTVNSPPPSISWLVTQVWLGGGTLNTPSNPAEVSNSVYTEGGRELRNAIKVVVQQYNYLPTVIIQMMSGQIVDYTLNWANRLLNGTDTIVSSSWSASDPTINISAYPSQIGMNNTKTTVWTSGGVVGKSYTITNTVKTAMGRTLEQSFILIIKQYVNCE